VELKLDEVVWELEEGGHCGEAFKLMPVELFLLLAAVLFHDVGRLGDSKTAKKGKGDDSVFLTPPDCWAIDIEEVLFEEFAKKYWDCAGNGEPAGCAPGTREHTCWMCLSRAQSTGVASSGKLLEDCPMQAFGCSSDAELLDKDFCGRPPQCPLFCLACRQRGWHKKLLKKKEESAGGKDHSVVSYEWLRDPTMYPSLGLRNLQLSRCLAAICIYHGDIGDIQEYYTPSMLHTTYLDAYGMVREKELAALLKLADNIDGSFRRASPSYIRRGEPAEIIGRFREKVSGIVVAPKAQMVLTELGDWSLDHQQRETIRKLFERHVGDAEFCRNSYVAPGLVDIVEGYKDAEPKKAFWDVFCCLPFKDGPAEGGHVPLKRRILDDLQLSPEPCDLKTRLLPTARATGAECNFNPEDAEAKKLVQRLAGDTVALGAVMSDVKRNAKTLRQIASELAGIGLPLHAWLIEYKDHLYTHDGRETFEPVFDRAYLRRICDCMEELTKGVLGQSEFTYETLAAGVRDPDANRVKMAVRRLSIITQDMKPRSDVMATGELAEGAIWYGEQLWRWNIEKSDTPTGIEHKLRQAAALVCRASNSLNSIDRLVKKAKEDHGDKIEELREALDQLDTAEENDMRSKEGSVPEIREIKAAVRLMQDAERRVAEICVSVALELEKLKPEPYSPLKQKRIDLATSLLSEGQGSDARKMAKLLIAQDTRQIKKCSDRLKFRRHICSFLAKGNTISDIGCIAASHQVLKVAERMLEDLIPGFFDFSEHKGLAAVFEKAFGKAKILSATCDDLTTAMPCSEPNDKKGCMEVKDSMTASMNLWPLFGIPIPKDIPSTNKNGEKLLNGFIGQTPNNSDGMLEYFRTLLELQKECKQVSDAWKLVNKSKTQLKMRNRWNTHNLHHVALYQLQLAEFCCSRESKQEQMPKFEMVSGQDVKKRIDDLALPVFEG
jgi:hypothetical protein